MVLSKYCLSTIEGGQRAGRVKEEEDVFLSIFIQARGVYTKKSTGSKQIK